MLLLRLIKRKPPTTIDKRIIKVSHPLSPVDFSVSSPKTSVVGIKVGLGIGVGVSIAVGVGVGENVGVGVEVGCGLDVGVGREVGLGMGVGVDVGLIYTGGEYPPP